MTEISLALVWWALALPPFPPPDPPTAKPFKLGTFVRQGRTMVGLVLDDRRVVELGPANADLERRHGDWKKLAMPADMKELIARHDDGLRERLHALAREAPAQAPYVYER